MEPLLKAWREYTQTHPNDTLLIVGGGELENKLKSEFNSISTIYLEGKRNIRKFVNITQLQMCLFFLP